MTRRFIRLSALLVTLAAPASAQLISIRTVPLAQADQFDIFPSLNLGMGGVSIALTDPLLDAFINPAKGARIGASRFFGSPGMYTVSSDAGGGLTLPLGTLLRAGPWFGGLALALQQVDASRIPSPVTPPIVAAIPTCLNCRSIEAVLPPAEQTHGNQFAFFTLGRVLPGTGLSLGGSVFWAKLTGVDGVDMLYARSAQVKQFGHAVDLRLGATKMWAGDRSLEALVLHNRLGMTHDVTYLDFFWDPGAQQVLQRTRMEENLDQTNTWGLHLAYQQPVGSSGWRIGWLATGNRMSHPKIPNYEIVSTMNIPRDPGYSWAYNLGMGVSRRAGTATFGLDAIYEPIQTATWADATTPIQTQRGDSIPVGGRTIENRFHFSNALFRMGFGDEIELGGPGRVAGLQLGLAIHSIHYRLSQQDNVQLSTRYQNEQWVEWTPTWGLSLRFPKLEIRYRGQVTNGTGRPGVAGVCNVCEAPVPAAGGILVAPSGPLTLTPVRVFTHQVSFALPLR